MQVNPLSFLNFVTEFFANPVKVPKHTSKALRKAGDGVWAFLTLGEVLHMSVVSRFSASLVISTDTIHRFLSSDPRVSHIGRFRLTFASDISLGILRRMLARMMTGTEGTLGIDATTGRVILDIGSAFKDKDAYMAAAHVVSTPVDKDTASQVSTEVGEDDKGPEILKYLEVSSYDEYDDFNPRHPNPRDVKGHKRGDSYFNSDIESVAQEALAGLLDMTSISEIEPGAGIRKSGSGRISRVQSKLGMASPLISSNSRASSDEEDDSDERQVIRL